MNLIPDEYQSDGYSTPVLIYPYERTRAALDSMARAGKPHPAHGFRLRYANPANGKHPFPTMAVTMQRLPAGFAGKTYRSTGSAVFAVHKGGGEAQVGEESIRDRAARRVRRAAVGALQLHAPQASSSCSAIPTAPARRRSAIGGSRSDDAPARSQASSRVGLAAPRRCTRSRSPSKTSTMAVPAVGFPFVAGYVADGLGLWEKHGLRVKTVLIAGIGSTNAVISGSAEFAQISGLSLTRAAANGQRLLAIVNTTDKPITEISIRKDIATAANFDPKAPLDKRAQILKGHTFAIGGVNTVVHAYLRIVAVAGGLDPESIRVAPMAGDNMLAGHADQGDRRHVHGAAVDAQGHGRGHDRAGGERRRGRSAAPVAARLQRGGDQARHLREAPLAVREDGPRLRRGDGLSSATTPRARSRS